MRSDTVMAVGAVCFGIGIGFITYRTLVRTTQRAAISDIAAVIGAVGGGAVTGLFDPEQTDLFGWYSIGLVSGMAVFFVLYLVMNGRDDTAKVMSGKTITGPDMGTYSDSEHAVGPRR
jgi:hypothetical protein